MKEYRLFDPIISEYGNHLLPIKGFEFLRQYEKRFPQTMQVIRAKAAMAIEEMGLFRESE